MKTWKIRNVRKIFSVFYTQYLEGGVRGAVHIPGFVSFVLGVASFWFQQDKESKPVCEVVFDFMTAAFSEPQSILDCSILLQSF